MDFKVIIIDDEALVAEDLRRQVEAVQFNVIGVFYSANDALNEAGKLGMDLAFIDIDLGGNMDGFALADELIQHYGTPVVFITGYGDISTIRRAATFVPYGYLLKPFSQDTVRIALEVAKARIEAERKNIISEKRYRDLFETLPAAFASHELLYDNNGTIDGYRIRECNNLMRILFDEMGIGEAGYLEGFFPDSGIEWLELMHRVGKSGTIETFEILSTPLRGWYSVVLYGSLPGECGLLMMNITERKQMEEKLANLNAQLENLAEYQQNILETERNIIAGNIHDYLGQYLTAISMDLSFFEKHFPNFSKEKMIDYIARTKNLVKEAVVSVRNLCTDLRADVLENLGIIAAIEWYVKERLQNAPLDVELNFRTREISVDLMCATRVFRVFQEAITNVLRHADATHVKVRLEADADALVLEVEDDGIGIPEDALAKIDSHGLTGMRERARQCGGSVEFIRRRPSGTIVRFIVPCNQ